AARRVRETGRKPRDGGAAGEAGVMLSAGASLSPEVQALHDRIAQLTAENEYLRGQVAELQAKLAG
ncbi:MAG TPA: plasmid replication/partition related protein, partial [Burkholderiaceae bacterium]